MASACNFTAPNGEQSDLGIALEQSYGPAEALEMMQVLRSDAALKIFDWVNNTQYNTAKEELTPEVAKALYDAVINGTAFKVQEPRATYTGLVQQLKSNEVFVFGSNPLGVNGNPARGTGGAALVAHNIAGVKQGEKMDNKLSASGKAWGLTTVTGPGKKLSMTPAQITEGIGKLYAHATANPDQRFLVAYQGTDGKNLNGYSNQELADMFSNQPIPSNMVFEEQFSTLLPADIGVQVEPAALESPHSITDFLPDAVIGIKNNTIDKTALNNTLKSMLPEILDADGNPTGQLYTFEDHKDINDMVTFQLLRYMLPKLTGASGKVNIVNELVSGLNLVKIMIKGNVALLSRVSSGAPVTLPATHPFSNIITQLTPAQAETTLLKYTQALNSFPNIVKFTAESLKEYGIAIKPNVISRLTKLLKYDEKTVVREGAEDTLELPEELQDYSAELDEGKSIQSFSEKAINLDLHATASKNVKMFLAGLSAMEFSKPVGKKDSEVIKTATLRDIVSSANKLAMASRPGTTLNNFRLSEKKNSLNQPILLNHKDLFIKLMKIAQTVPNFRKEDFLKTLKQASDPDVVNLGVALESAPQQILNELFKVANNQYSVATRVLVGARDSKGNKALTARNIVANKGNETATIIDEWRENQKVSKSVSMEGGRMVVNKKGAEKIYSTLVANGVQLKALAQERLRIGTALAKLRGDLSGRTLSPAQEAQIYEPLLQAAQAQEEATAAALDNAAKFLEYLGITGITPEMLRKIPGGFEASLLLSAELKPIGMLTKLADTLRSAAAETEIESTNLLKNSNPLYREPATLDALARLKAQYSGEVRFATNHKGLGGDTVQNFSLPSFASDTYKALANSSNMLATNMLANSFAGKAKWLLDQIVNKSVGLTYLEGLVHADKPGEGVERSEMSIREQYMTPLLMFHQNSKKADFVDMTKSDKTVTPVVSNVEKFMVNKVGFTDAVIDQFENIFKAEFERVNTVTYGVVTDPKLSAGGKLFYFMPAFNYENMSKDSSITPAEMTAMWNPDGSIQAVYNPEVLKPLIIKYMGAALAAETASWITQLKGFGGLELFPDAQTKYMLNKHFGLVPNMEKNDTGRSVQKGWMKVLQDRTIVKYTNEKALEMSGRMLVKQYVTQAFIVNTMSAMIVSGDPAIAFKPNKATKVNDVIKNTLKEYQKRQAKDVAPGAIPNFEPGSSFVSMTIADPKIQSAMAAINPKYKDADTIADAQELTTVREQLTVMFAEGKIADKVFAEMKAVIDAGLQTPGKFYEFTDPAHLEVVLQAQKPVYVNRRFNDGSYTVDYIKSSSFAMLPQMTIGTELDKLRVAMEGTVDKKGVLNGHINRAVFGSGKKLGQPMNPVTIFDKNGLVIAGALESIGFSGAQQTLSRDGFKIQQEVPFKGEKEHIDLVSQADRFITSGISTMDGFEFPGEGLISGKRLKQIRLDTIKEMSKRSLAAFTEEIGGIQDITDNDGAWVSSKLADPTRFFDKLLNEAVAKGYSPNEIEQLRSRTLGGVLQVPLWFSGSSNKLESMVMSLIGSITVPKIPGKSFVQASSIGIKRYSTEVPVNAGIKYIKSYDPTKGLQFMTRNEGGPSGAAQVLVPFNFFADQGERINLEDFMAEDGTIDPAKLPDEVLRMVGMRIPNQGHNSMLPIQIVGFLPASMGDLIIVPAEITTQMGSDFDVDKLYTYRSNYFHNAQEKTLSVYGGESDGKNLQDKYFNVFWSALTHPEMFNRVTNPLDQPDMIVEKGLAEGAADDSLSNFFMPSSQIESYNAQKDAKRMVALTALSGTFMSDVQDMSISFPDGVSSQFKDDAGNLINLTKFSGEGRSAYTQAGAAESRSKHDVNSALQNEVLDYAKNRTIDALNINLKTYPAVDMMINLESTGGVSIGWSHIARFTQQPIIKEYVAKLSSNNDMFSDYYSGDQHNKVVKQLIEKYASAAYLLPTQEIPQIAFSPQELLDMVDGDTEDRQTAMNQLSILKNFDTLHRAGVFKMRAQGVFNRGPKGPGANFVEASDLQDKATQMTYTDTEFDDVPLSGMGELMSGANSQRGDEFTKTVGTAMKIGDDVMPYKNIKPIIAELASLKGKETLAPDDVLKINNGLKAYFMTSKRMKISDNVTGRLAELIYDSNGQLNLAKRVAEAKNTEWGRANFFLSRLKTYAASSDIEPSTVSYSPIKTTVFEDQENTKGIIELLNGTPEQLALIQDLIDYNYLSGSTGGPSSYNRFIPISYIIGRGLDSSMRAIMKDDGWKGFTRNFTQQFLQHNPGFAPILSSTLRGTVNQEINPEARYAVNEHLALRKAEAGEDFKEAFNGEFPKYFAVKSENGHLLYRLSGFDNGAQTYNYVRIDTLGQGSLQEYNAADLYKRSIIIVNKALAKVQVLMDGELPSYSAPFERQTKQEDSTDHFYADFVEVGKNSTTALEFIDKLIMDESPLLKVLKQSTMQDVEINANLNSDERIAEYRTKSNKIQLNTSRIGSKTQVIRAVEHEYLHAVTARTLADIHSLTHEQGVKKYGQVVMDAYYSLEEMRKELAANHSSELMQYATSSIDELIAHAFSNREVQALLNNTPVENGSLWSKFTNLVKSLINALAAQLGVDVNEGSALNSIINDAAAIIGSNGRGQDFKAQEDTFLGAVFIDDSDLSVSIPAEVKTALKDIQAHKAKLESMQFSQSSIDDTKRSSFVLRGQEIDNLTADIDSLKRMGSFTLLATLGVRQVAWAKTMLGQVSKSDEDLMAAYHTAKTWSNLITNMYDGVDQTLLSDTIKNLQGDAAAIEAQVIVEFKKSSGIAAADFTPESLATGAAQAFTRDLGQVKSQVGQMIYERISEQKKFRTEELRKFNGSAEKMISKIEALAKSRGITYKDVMEKMIQSGNEWGMVNRYSPALATFQKGMQTTLQYKLQLAYSAKNLTPDQRLTLIKAAKKEYKTKMDSKMSYVNVSILLNHQTGALKTGADVDFEMTKLNNEIGPEVVDRMVKQAQRNYKQYLDEKESYENVITATHDNNTSQITTIYAKELAALDADGKLAFVTDKFLELESQKDAKLQAWEAQNSPIVFYQMLAGIYPKGLSGQFRAYGRLVTAPKTSSTEFFDPKFKEITDDLALNEIYTFIQDNLTKHVNMLPVSVQSGLGDDFLPIIAAADDSLTFGNALGRVKEATRDALLARETLLEHLQGEGRAIPLKYVKGKNTEIADRQRDPMVLLSKFVDMSLHYNGMAHVQAYAELAQQAVIQATRKTAEGRFAVFNKGAENLAKQVQHYLDVEMYQKARAQEGIAKSDVYSLDPLKNRRIKKQIADNTAQAAALEEQYRNGTISISELAAGRTTLMTEMDELTKDKSHLTASNVADVAIRITQMKALSWNPMSAIANVTFGVISLQIHAQARTDFDNKTMLQAMATMTQATRNALGGSNMTAQKILALMDRTNLMGDLLDSDSPGESRLQSRGKERWKKVISPYQMLRQSDYYMKGSIAVAMAKFKLIEVERNGAMVTMSLWDAMDNEGKIEGNSEWYNEDDSSVETQFNAFRNKAVGVGKVIMGNQDSNSPIMIKRTAVGRLVTQFRISWLAEGVAQRFEDEHVNNQLGRTVKGRYRTYSDIGIMGSLKMLASQAIASKTAFELNGEQIADVDVENMRKNFAEVAWALTMMGVMLTLKGMVPDDEDKKSTASKALWFTLNMVTRTQGDISFFANPGSATETLSNIVPASKVLVDFVKAVDGTRRIMFDDDSSSFTEKQMLNRWFKTLPPLSLIPKLERQMSKVL